jgi:hypothetical protein
LCSGRTRKRTLAPAVVAKFTGCFEEESSLASPSEDTRGREYTTRIDLGRAGDRKIYGIWSLTS